MKFKLVEAVWKPNNDCALNRHYLKHCADLLVRDEDKPDTSDTLMKDLGYPQVKQWRDEYKKRAEDLSNAKAEPLLSLDDVKPNVVYGFIQSYEDTLKGQTKVATIKFRKKSDNTIECVAYSPNNIIQSYYLARWGRLRSLFSNKLKGLDGELPENRKQVEEILAKKKAEQEAEEKAKAEQEAAEKDKSDTSTESE